VDILNQNLPNPEMRQVYEEVSPMQGKVKRLRSNDEMGRDLPTPAVLSE